MSLSPMLPRFKEIFTVVAPCIQSPLPQSVYLNINREIPRSNAMSKNILIGASDLKPKLHCMLKASTYTQWSTKPPSFQHISAGLDPCLKLLETDFKAR